MIKTPEERRRMIPPALSSEIDFHYIHSRDLDPVNRISYTRNLASALKTAIQITDEPELLPQLNASGNLCFLAQDAFQAGDWVKSNFYIDQVLDRFLGPLVHGGFGSLQEGSFSLPVSNAEVK